MSFHAWCACQALDAERRAESVCQELLRRRFVREAAAETARLWALVEARMNFSPSITRDIREWRTEP